MHNKVAWRTGEAIATKAQKCCSALHQRWALAQHSVMAKGVLLWCGVGDIDGNALDITDQSHLT